MVMDGVEFGVCSSWDAPSHHDRGPELHLSVNATHLRLIHKDPLCQGKTLLLFFVVFKNVV